MKNMFKLSGDTVKVYPVDLLNLKDSLPPVTYSLMYSQEEGGYYLKVIKDMELPTKIYGNSNSYCKRIYNTYKTRNKSTGVLLSGEKGSGKTLLSKQLSLKALREGIPTIVVSEAHKGASFNLFIQSLGDCVLIFDEFEKVYDLEDQSELLTLLDGVCSSKKLMLFTVNNEHKIDMFMINRPGRIFYNIRYSGVDNKFIKEYCNDNLQEFRFLPDIEKLLNYIVNFNFDMLQCVVEECNRYPTLTFKEILSCLNISNNHSIINYSCLATLDGKPLVEGTMEGLTTNVLVKTEFNFCAESANKLLNSDDEYFIDIMLKKSDIAFVNWEVGEVVYEKQTSKGLLNVVFTEEKQFKNYIGDEF